MTCPQLRRKWWHRLTIGVALILATLSAGAVVFVTQNDAQGFWNVFGGPILVFMTVFFAIFVPYRILVRIAVGKISN